MIIEGRKPDFDEIIKTAESKMPLRCEHDFWDMAKLATYGDIFLCQRCSQYFTKIKHMPCIIKGKELPSGFISGLGKIKIKAQSNHKNCDVWVRVPVRILSNKSLT